MCWIILHLINFYIISAIVQLCSRSQKDSAKGESTAVNNTASSRRETSQRSSKPEIRDVVLDSIRVMKRGIKPNQTQQQQQQSVQQNDFSSSRRVAVATSEKEDSLNTLSINVPLGKAGRTPPESNILVQPQDRKEYETSQFSVKTPKVGFSAKLRKNRQQSFLAAS